MSKLLNASICLSDILIHAKKGHSAFSKSEKNGKIYFDINVWLNDEKDRYKNDASITLNSKKENKDKEGKIYIGNGRFNEKVGMNKSVTADDIPNDENYNYGYSGNGNQDEF